MVEGGRHLIGTSSALILTTVGIVVGELVFYAALHLVISRFLRGVNAWLGAVLTVVLVVTVFLLSNPPGRLGTLLFVGISLLVTAARADAGCEVMTLPSMLFGQRTHLVCIAFSPVDWFEKALERRRSAVDQEGSAPS